MILLDEMLRLSKINPDSVPWILELAIKEEQG